MFSIEFHAILGVKEAIYMELRVLQYFLAVAREQSISSAAESLHLSQPTLSTQIKAMEDELGKKLFIRGTKGSRKVTLTEEGMILCRRAEEILDLVKKTESEIQLSDKTITGDVYIGAGETDVIRFFAQAANKLKQIYPDIHYHIYSGNSTYVIERLDKGLIDFGLVYGTIDHSKYESIEIPIKDTFGILMKKDSPLADKEYISPEDLWDKPLIMSHQEERDGWPIAAQIRQDVSKLNIIATYNLLFNGSLMVEEGLGYAVCFDKLINTTGDSSLCFRPIKPSIEISPSIIWKKYQVFSKAADKFLQQLKEIFYDFK